MSSLLREGSIGYILFKSRIITERDIETALEAQKRTGLRFGETLVSLGIVMQEDIDWALSNQLDIPYARISRESIDPAAAELVPAAVARKFNLFPLIRTDEELRIAMADPLDREAVAEVERLTGCNVSISMGLLREIREMQDFFYGEAGESALPGFSSTCFSSEVLEAINNDGTGDKLLDSLLAYLLQEGLSAISLKPLDDRVMVAGRQGPLSRPIGSILPAHYDELLSRIRTRAGIADSGSPSSISSLVIDIGGKEARFQVNLMQAGRWSYVTFKPFYNSPFPENLEKLETSDRNRQALRDFASAPEGMVLFSATSLEERTHLMAALMRECGCAGRDLLLVGKGFSFCSAMFPVVPVDWFDPDIGHWIRGALNHDPSVIAVEGLSDSPSISAAIDAVLKGKLLFGGMPFPGIRATMRQVLFLKERLPLLPGSLRGIAACREIRLLCPACKEAASPADQTIRLLPKKLPSAFYQAKGCPDCRFSGYGENKRLIETLTFDEETTELLNQSKNCGDFLRAIGRKGFHGIVEEAAGLLDSGNITAEEFISVTTENGERPWPE